MYINFGKTNAVVTFKNSLSEFSVQIYLSQGVWNELTKIFVPIPDVRCNEIYITQRKKIIQSVNRFSSCNSSSSDAYLEVSDIYFFESTNIARITGLSQSPVRWISDEIEDMFLSEKMMSNLNVVRDALYRAKFKTEPYLALLEVCKIFENEGKQAVSSLISCYDLGIRIYGNKKYQYNDFIVIKERYRSLLRLELWDEAETFVSELDEDVTQSGWPIVLKARALSAAGRTEESEREWKIVLSKRPHDREAKKELGVQ